jgi:hypothetical protein
MFDEGSEGHNLQVRLNCEQDFIPVVRLQPEVDVSNETAAAKSPQCRYVQPFHGMMSIITHYIE